MTHRKLFSIGTRSWAGMSLDIARDNKEDTHDNSIKINITQQLRSFACTIIGVKNK
jgi:hypothetical protein